MDNQSIEPIIALAAAGLGALDMPDGSIAAYVPPGYSLQNLEHRLLAPVRKRGTTVLHDASSFVSFFNQHKGEASRLYAVIEPASFTAVFNDNAEDPGWADHRATYACPLAKEWAIWRGHSGKQMDQIAFAEFIEANLPDINGGDTGPSGADLLEVATNFKATGTVKFASGTRLQNGTVDFTYQEEVNGTAGAKGDIKVPETFFLAIPVLEGGSPYKVEVKLRYRLKDGRLSLWYELIRDHKILEAAFKDVWTLIEAGTKSPILRGIPAKQTS